MVRLCVDDYTSHVFNELSLNEVKILGEYEFHYFAFLIGNIAIVPFPGFLEIYINFHYSKEFELM